jgi:hypothetical protein
MKNKDHLLTLQTIMLLLSKFISIILNNIWNITHLNKNNI